MRPLRPLLVAWLAVLALAPVKASAPAYRYSREVQAATPGWVRVRLPASLLVRLSPEMDDLAVEDQGGQRLPIFPWKGPAEPAPSLRAAALTDMTRVPGGWRVTADLGSSSGRHRMVALDVPGTGLAEAVTVEASPDGRIWRLAARGAMFRLNRWGMTAKTYLEYPPTSDRYLRVFWPEPAGFPAWKSLLVADWPDGIGPELVEESLGYSAAWTSGRETYYRVDAPRQPLGRASLHLALALPYPVHARLLVARDGKWDTVTEAYFMPGQTPRLPIPSGACNGLVSLALSAGEFSVPPLKSLALRYEPRWAVFQAPAAGTYTLRYGALGGAPQAAAVETLPIMPAAEVGVLGSERELLLPDLPAPTLAMGADLPAVAFARRWSLDAPGAREQNLVGLEVPPECYSVARRDLADLRLAYAGRQVPFVLWEPADGVQASALKGARPHRINLTNQSEIVLELSVELLPLVCAEISTPSAPFSRNVRLEAFEMPAHREGLRSEAWTVLDQGMWRCPGISEIPARFVLRASTVGTRRLRLVFEDGDNAPLPSVDVVLWRRRHVLFFPWTGAGVQLCAGAKDLSPPSYDLAALKEDIIHRPALAASVVLASADSAGQTPRQGIVLGRWTLLAALLTAAILLVGILARSLGKQSVPGAGGTP